MAQAKSNFFEWVGKPNDQGPRTKGTPHAGGSPTITPCTASYDAKKVPTWPEQSGVETGGVYAKD